MSPHPRRPIDRPALFAGLAALVFVTGCSGGGSTPGAAVPPASSGSSRLGTAKMTITVPARAAAQSLARPRYVSVSTTQLLVDVRQGGASLSGFPQTIQLTPTSPNCTSTAGGTTCTITVNVQPGAYVADLTAEDSSGRALSTAQSVALTITAGTVNQVPIVLSGVPASISLSTTSPLVTGTQAAGFTLVGPGAHAFVVNVLDADGNIIVGAGSPTLSTSESGTLNVSVVPPSPPGNVLTVAPPATYGSGSATVTVNATFPGQTNACTATGAVCTTTATFNEQELVAVALQGANEIVLFADQTTTVLETVTNGVVQPDAVLFDSSGNLIVANYGNNFPPNSTVTVYAPPYNGTPGTISNGIVYPGSLAVDASGNLYVGNVNNAAPTVTEYAPGYAAGSTAPSRTLNYATGGVVSPVSICTDPSGDLFVDNQSGNGSLEEFAPGTSTTPTAMIPGLFEINEIACDSLGNVFAAQYGYNDNFGYEEISLNKYGPALAYITSLPAAGPHAIHVDSANNLYVANGGTGGVDDVERFASGGHMANLTITAGVNEVTSIGVSSAGNITTTNDYTPLISEYLAGSSALNATFTPSNYHTSGIAVSP